MHRRRTDEDRREHRKRRTHAGHRRPRATLTQVTVLALTVWAVVKELRTPPPQRTWHGVIAGVVPYDFRVPSIARIRARVWNPSSESLLGPRVFGVGWTVNLGRVVELVRHGPAD